MEEVPNRTITSMSASFRIEMQELVLPPESSFEIFALFEEDRPDRQAVAIKLGNTHGQLWVAVESMDDEENVVSSPHRGLARVLSETSELLFQIAWNRSLGNRPGSASLDVDGVSSSFSLDLWLDNHTLEPDYVRVGVGESDLPPDSPGSFLLDEINLRTVTVN